MNRLFIVVLLLTAAFGFRPLIAQEAVAEKPASEVEPEETATEEPTPAEESTAAEVKKDDATPKKSTKDLREMMSPEEFNAAGLDKLSPEELQKLSALMQGYRKKAEKKAAEKAAAEATAKTKEETTKKVRASFFSTREPTASRIAGTLGPLTGHTILTLEDGTKWKQANEEDRYRPRVTDHPVVFVIHTAFGYRMRIPGMPEFYVNPVPDK